ncbi:hypothetical protein F5X99DRAFT_427935 [Biscogniauxia marginata]|nr:hypothetical protein F5X99DRAFT_427935 [Biscogniauxia marginata]
MKSTNIINSSLWLLLGLAQARPDLPEDPIHDLVAALETRGDVPSYHEANGRWQRCGSSYEKQLGTKYGVFFCALELGTQREKSFTVSSGGESVQVCEHSNTKIWIQANPAAGASSGTSETYTLQAWDIGNVTLQGSDMCCPGVLEAGAPKTWEDPCGGWGYLGTTPGGMEIIITANNDDGPEPVPCNDLPIGSCP